VNQTLSIIQTPTFLKKNSQALPRIVTRSSQILWLWSTQKRKDCTNRGHCASSPYGIAKGRDKDRRQLRPIDLQAEPSAKYMKGGIEYRPCQCHAQYHPKVSRCGHCPRRNTTLALWDSSHSSRTVGWQKNGCPQAHKGQAPDNRKGGFTGPTRAKRQTIGKGVSPEPSAVSEKRATANTVIPTVQSVLEPSLSYIDPERGDTKNKKTKGTTIKTGRRA